MAETSIRRNHVDYYIYGPELSERNILIAAERRYREDGHTSTVHYHPKGNSCEGREHNRFGTNAD